MTCKPLFKAFPALFAAFLALPCHLALGQAFSEAGSATIDYTTGSIAPRQACADLANLNLRDVVQMSVQMIPASGAVPAHCRIDGTIAPEIAFQVNLPAGWNGRFYMTGNGGHAGQQPSDPFQAPNRDGALTNHFVMAMTDTGHDSAKEPGASFVMSNPQKAIDYAYRAVHMTAVTSKEIARAYYGQPVSYSYWNSCSNGGRQGLLEAQRYPDDFEGIIANAPWVSQTGFTIGALWNQRAMEEVSLTADKMKLVADSVMEKCDAVDGLEDGLIDDPRSCPVNVANDVPMCSTGVDNNSCLTPEQANAVQKVYDGPRDSQGNQIFPGFMPGSEALVNGNSSWMGLIVPATAGASTADFGLAEGTMRYLVPLTPQPEWDYLTFDFDSGPELLDRWSRLADATDTNLREFRANGGKLIMTYGWADTILQPMMGVDYYEQAVLSNGADGTDFMRLFMAPGMTHCAGGNGPDQHDPVSAIIDWVEAEEAPDMMVASRIVNGETVRSRPLCPYPQTAQYDGSGSIDEAENFMCAIPENTQAFAGVQEMGRQQSAQSSAQSSVQSLVQQQSEEGLITDSEQCTEKGGFALSFNTRGLVRRDECSDEE